MWVAGLSSIVPYPYLYPFKGNIRTQAHTHESGVLPYPLWVFLRVPIRPESSCHPYWTVFRYIKNKVLLISAFGALVKESTNINFVLKI